MRRILTFALSVAFLANAAPAAAFVRPPGGAPPPPSHPAPQAPAPRPPSMPQRQPAQPHQPMQQPHQPPVMQQHFNLNNDLHPVYHRPPSAVPGGEHVVSRPPVATHSPYQPTRIPAGHVIIRQHYNPNPWGWNHGVVWYPAPVYWGGGFWGPFAFGTAVVGFGYLPYEGFTYNSYQAQPDSPGADLLSAYGLTQTPCGPPNLVVIWGPDNSVICAFPNDVVGPGNYQVDPSTLTLVSSPPSDNGSN